jgi:segregation and condensation protein B
MTDESTPEPQPAEHPPNASDDRPLSLNRLREAFAEMLSPHPPSGAAPAANQERDPDDGEEVATGAEHDPCEICPRSVVEAMLFVGRPDNHSLSSRELAAAMRGVSPGEIDAAVAELNAIYTRDAAPYEIVGSGAGYRMVLRNEFGRMRDKFQGRVREAKLSPAAVEVLSIVAYHQPITAEAVQELRGAPSGSALATLVRRKLVRLDRPTDPAEKPHYVTTDRFLRLFGLESIQALPRSEELQEA